MVDVVRMPTGDMPRRQGQSPRSLVASWCQMRGSYDTVEDRTTHPFTHSCHGTRRLSDGTCGGSEAGSLDHP
jgi:hypothetical protein